ncbi:MAG: ribosome maturation factor RimP [Sandaracinaceae bacterium]
MTTPDITTIHAIIEPVCRAHGVELVQVVSATEHGSAVLRVIIDREGSEAGPGAGVSLADCQAVSRDLGPALDVHDVVAGRYRLEVSSPGLDRPLVKESDFVRFAGREVKIKTREPRPDGRGGERRSFSGTLLGIDDSAADGAMVRLECEGAELHVPFTEIAKANVVHRFD